MRCRVGDLAVVVRPYFVPENLGKVCRVLRWNEWLHCWDIEFPAPIRWGTGALDHAGHADDEQLRPIRDNDGADETLSWKTLPSPIEVITEIAHEQ